MLFAHSEVRDEAAETPFELSLKLGLDVHGGFLLQGGLLGGDLLGLLPLLDVQCHDLCCCCCCYT